MKHRKSIPFILGLLVIAFLYRTSSVAVGQMKPAKARAPIKIGYLAPLSGPSGAIGTDMKDGFLLYLEQKGNQMAGQKVEALVEDDEAKPDVGLTKTKKLLERDNVQIIIGTMHSGVAQAIAEYIKAQKKILFICNSGSDGLTQHQFSPYIFRNSFNNSQVSHPLGEWAYRKGYRKASLVGSDYTAGYEWVGGFARTFIQAGGTVIQEQYIPLGTHDPAPFVTAIKSDAEVVYAFLPGADGMRFVPAYDQYGVKKRTALLGAALTDAAIVQKEGDSAIGVITSDQYVDTLDNPATKAFIAAFMKSYNRLAGAYSEMGYSGAMVLDKALQAIGGNIENIEALSNALQKLEIPDSPRGPIKFDKYHNVVHNIYITQVKKADGQLVHDVIDTYKDVSQFWKWSPEEYLKMPTYISMKGKWAK